MSTELEVLGERIGSAEQLGRADISLAIHLESIRRADKEIHERDDME